LNLLPRSLNTASPSLNRTGLAPVELFAPIVTLSDLPDHVVFVRVFDVPDDGPIVILFDCGVQVSLLFWSLTI